MGLRPEAPAELHWPLIKGETPNFRRVPLRSSVSDPVEIRISHKVRIVGEQ